MSEAPTDLRVHVFDVPLQISVAAPELLAAVRGILPPNARSDRAVAGPLIATIARAAGGGYDVTDGTVRLAQAVDAVAAVKSLDAHVRMYLSTHVRSHVLIHAGAVAYRGRGIVLPGASHAGKSTLVAALLRHGAVYYSDEFAVIDGDGRLHPYPRPISLRGGAPGAALDVAPAQFGAPIGIDAIEIGLIAVTRHVAGATWAPRELSAADGALALFVNTAAARADPERILPVLRKATAGARVLNGPRGEAAAAARRLLAELTSGPTAPGSPPHGTG